MILSRKVALATMLLASPVEAEAGVIGSTVNITTTVSTVYSDRITEVVVVGEGTYTYPDPYTAPLLTETTQAIATALDELGLPMGTSAAPQGTVSIGGDDTWVSSYTSNYNPVDNPDYVIGDPDDYFTWIAVGDEDVEVFATVDETIWTFYRLTAEILEACGPGTYSATGNEPCSPCATGYFQSLSGATSCQSCPAGSFGATMGLSFCSPCGPGTFELDTGSAVCDPCPGGQATPCNDNGVCSDGPTGNGTCTCDSGYSGFACENGPPTTTTTSTTLDTTTTTLATTTTTLEPTTTTSMTTTTTSTTSTTLPGPCADLPQTGCVVAAKAGFQIQTKSDPAKNKLKWKLGGGSLAVAYADLGDPAASTTWTLCIYDSLLGTPYLAGSIAVAPSASSWTAKPSKGWKFKDNDGNEDGVTGASLGAGDAGKPKAQLKAGGSNLPLPLPFDTAKFFHQGSAVTVQLVREGGPGADLCWTSQFDAADTKSNSAASFKAAAK